nr:S-layer homology domain-containing protein [uncultured Romboutsia sp.]
MVFKKKFLSSVIALGLVVSNMFISNANSQQLEVHHINVGQGESIYIELPDGSDILIDAGKSNYGNTVVNYLKGQEKDIDIEYLIATHPDADHVGGMQQVFKDLKVKNFIYPKDAPHDTKTWQNVLSLANAEGCTIKDSTSGTAFNIGGTTMKFIQSTADYSDNNDDSVVTYLEYKDVNFMFTGDIEADAEKDMVAQNLVPDVDFMSVPHHGSKGSSTEAFLAKAKPEHAIVSVGADNSYGHPTADALNRYNAIRSKVYRTDQLGDIVIKTDGNTASINGNNVDASGMPSDITGHWAENQIKDFINKGYLNGYPDGTFKPQTSITRAEFVKTLNKAFGLTTKSGKVFDDTVWHWAKDDIDIAVTNGVCQGTSDTTFEPNAPITREQAAKMIANYKKIADTHHDKINGYNDGSQTASWAINEVEAILEAGYMNGYSDTNTFKPKNNITRAEAVVTLGRVISNPNPEIPEPPVVPEPPVTPPVEEPTPVPPVTEDISSIVYANGGSSSSNKYHKSANAHGMKGAIKMTKSEAEKKGYVACGSCYR